MNNDIEEVIEINAPIADVWRAVSDHREFGTWFLVNLENPFEVGAVTRGVITHPECAGMVFTAVTTRMDAPTHFSFRWPPDEFFQINHPDEVDGTTLVEFILEETDRGTRLTVVDNGFEVLPQGTRKNAVENNTKGWQEQMENIRAHVER